MARNLIRLSGFVPDEQIPIKFIGLRPGEKMTEELVGEGETLEPSEVPKIFRVGWPQTDASRLAEQVEAAVSHARQGQESEAIGHLLAIVPTFSRSCATHAGAGDRTLAGMGGPRSPHSPVLNPVTGAATPSQAMSRSRRASDDPSAYRQLRPTLGKRRAHDDEIRAFLVV
jgi:Polysaccharide biosynthesis protein